MPEPWSELGSNPNVMLTFILLVLIQQYLLENPDTLLLVSDVNNIPQLWENWNPERCPDTIIVLSPEQCAMDLEQTE